MIDSWRLRFRIVVALVLGSVVFSPSADAQDNRSSQVDYEITARIEPTTRGLSGSAVIEWHNRTADEVPDAWFHLHHNAFSNNYTTHIREAGGRLRGTSLDSGWSWQRVTSMVIGGQELVDAIRYEAPDDGSEEDRTVFSVPLPEPVQPDGTLTIELTWEAMLPRLRRRTGVSGDGNFLLLAHWFPKLGVYEGGQGWNCHQFHANTEFYADFGTYDVTIDLPEEYAGKVGASGKQEGAALTEGGRAVTRFLAPSMADRSRADHTALIANRRPLVHGFAVAADPDFVSLKRTFKFSDWKEEYPEEVLEVEAALGLSPGEMSLRDVTVIALMQPEHENEWRPQGERHLHATCAALFFYGMWFGEYPYEQLTVVDPAWSGSAAGGMEYPTLFTSGTSMFTHKDMHRPESVTVHECGHQFWYGLVGNNEYEAAWMDEGFNSYADSEVMKRVYNYRRASTRYSHLPWWGSRTAKVPAGTGLAGAMTGQRVDVGDRLGVVHPLQASSFISWWRDQPLLTLAEDREDPRWSDRSGYLRAPDVDPIRTNGWEYRDRTSYSTNSYRRTAVVLRSLRAVVGDAPFLKGINHYSRLWRYRHPYPNDFYEAFNAAAGVEVDWYFESLIEGTGTVDWGVTVSQRKSPELSGMILGDDGYERLATTEESAPEEPAPEGADQDVGAEEEPAQDDDSQASAADEAAVEAEDGSAIPVQEPAEPRDWLYDVVISRRGTLRLPVAVEILFKGGERRSFEWSREAQLGSNWWRLPIDPGKEKIMRVLIDPDRRYYLDTNMADNQWYEGKDLVAPLRWGERAFTQYAHLLHWFSSLGG